MNLLVPKVLKEKYLVLPFGLSLVLLLAASGKTLVNFWNLKGLIAIHFDSFRGFDFFGTRGDVYEILGIGAAVLILNIAIANSLYFKERFLSYLIAYATPFFSLLIYLGVGVIIAIN